MKAMAGPGRYRRLTYLTALAGTALMAAFLVGCSGDDGAPGQPGKDGQNGTPGAAGPAGPAGTDYNAVVRVPANTTAATDASSATWAALAPQITISSVAINSAPVVKFTVKDADGKPIVGLGSKSQSATQTVAQMPNIYFTLAKLVPATSTGDPSKWVSYLVVRPPSVAEKTATPGTALCDAATGASWCGTWPTVDREGTLKDNGDGSYEYTFYRDITKAATVVASLPANTADGKTVTKRADLGDVSYDKTATHRLGVQIGGNAPGTGSNTPNAVTVVPSVAMGTPANAVYDFRPDGGAVSAKRDIVALESCSTCHENKVLAHGSRKDPNYCVTCHTDQVRYSVNVEATTTSNGLAFTGSTNVINGFAVGDFPNMIHKVHMGKELVKADYSYQGQAKFNEVTYPQLLTNCVKCHDGSATAAIKTANGDNWKSQASAMACGSCHDGIDFKTGTGVTLGDRAKDHAAGVPIGTTRTGHVGRAQADNSKCTLCHDAASMPIDHTSVDLYGSVDRGGYPVNTAQDVPTVGLPSGFGPAIPLAAQFNLPAGVFKIGLELKSVAVSNTSPRKVTAVYRVLKDGTPVTFNATGFLIDNVDGAPYLSVAYGLPGTDGVSNPADWSTEFDVSIKDIRDAKNGHAQTGPDAAGWYTATIGTTIPDNGKMVTVGFGINYQGFVQLNHPSYPKGIRLREPAFKMMTATGKDVSGANNTARRAIVSNDKCNACHAQLGVSPSFHSGARNNGEGCAFCHYPDRATGHVGANYSYGGGWSVSAKNMVHAIHAAEMRSQPYTYEATAANPNGFAEVTYPGVLNKCEQCHVSGSYDFRNAANSAAVPNLLWTGDAKGNMTNAGGAASIGLSPWVTLLGKGQIDYRTDNLISSPIASSCFGCHDSSYAIGHMRQNGGTLVTLASTVTVSGTGDRTKGYVPNAWEGCMACHGPGGIGDIKQVHGK